MIKIVIIVATLVAFVAAARRVEHSSSSSESSVVSKRVARSAHRCDLKCPDSSEPCISYTCLITDIGKECVAVRDEECETLHRSHPPPAPARLCTTPESRFCTAPACGFVECIIKHSTIECIPGADHSQNGRACNGNGVCTNGTCSVGSPPTPTLPPTPNVEICSAEQIVEFCASLPVDECNYMSCVVFSDDQSHLCGALPNISANGIACDDHNVLTVNDRCLNGVCEGRNIFAPTPPVPPPRLCTPQEFNDSCLSIFTPSPCLEITCAAFCNANGVYVPTCNQGVNVSAVGVACDDNNTFTINDVCCTDGVCRGSPTPTHSPTTSPTLMPSNSPTQSPSQNPTISPTGSPTKQPSQSPTRSPTPSPTTCASNTPNVLTGDCGGDCICVCFDMPTLSYCGACNVSSCPFGTTPSCRPRSEGFTADSIISINNSYILSQCGGGIDSVACTDLFKQMIYAIAAAFNMSNANVVVSSAQCSSV